MCIICFLKSNEVDVTDGDGGEGENSISQDVVIDTYRLAEVENDLCSDVVGSKGEGRDQNQYPHKLATPPRVSLQ